MRATRLLAVPALLLLMPAAVGADRAPLRVDSTLPSWRAPGGAFTVVGWSEPGAGVTLAAGRNVLGRAPAGPRGRYELVARAPLRSGAYWLRAASGTVA